MENLKMAFAALVVVCFAIAIVGVAAQTLAACLPGLAVLAVLIGAGQLSKWLNG